MAPLVLLILLAVKPLPEPQDKAAGEAASACIYYYRLQSPEVPGGTARCEEQGYGLEFMRARWAEIAELEQKRKAKHEALLVQSREIAAAHARAGELEAPCLEMILDGGSGPDGGQALCDLAGFTRVRVVRQADHLWRLRVQADSEAKARNLRRGLILALGLLLVSAVTFALRRRR